MQKMQLTGVCCVRQGLRLQSGSLAFRQALMLASVPTPYTEYWADSQTLYFWQSPETVSTLPVLKYRTKEIFPEKPNKTKKGDACIRFHFATYLVN